MSDLTAARAAATVARHDIYSGIHRALRLFMSDTLGRIGALDPSDAGQLGAALSQRFPLLALCRSHVGNDPGRQGLGQAVAGVGACREALACDEVGRGSQPTSANTRGAEDAALCPSYRA